MSKGPGPIRLHEQPASTLHQLFEDQASLAADRPAVTCGDVTVTYRELNERANCLAHSLRSIGVGPAQLVAVYLERSIDLIVGILAVLKAGCGYVPIDPDCPCDRLAFLLNDAAVSVVLAHRNLVSHLPSDLSGLVILDDQPSPFDAQPATNPVSSVDATDVAYVIYTSGSSGVPKGVLIEHRSVVGLLRSTDALFRFDGNDAWAMSHSAAFDFSVWEMWGALLHGARLVVVQRATARSPEDFYRLLAKERVTVLNQTPSAFAQLIHMGDSARPTGEGLSLRYVIFGGEALDPRSLRRWFDTYGDEHPRLVNMFGITETTVHVTFRSLTSEDASRTGSVIGFPIPGYQVYLLDETRQPSAAGDVGEMWVGGVGVARGYLNRPDLTSDRFIADPFGGEDGGRLYRSGDLARRLHDGELEYVGRIDDQIKIRGFRVELGEIEAVLGSHEGVAHCAVVARDDLRMEKRIVAYWVSRVGASPTVAALRDHLACSLPEYMMPSAFVELQRLPLTVNGKLDRRSLPAPSNERPEIHAAYEAPRDERESDPAAIWSERLGVDRVGIHDNFFELGGHSLLVTRIAADIRARFGVHLRPSLLFDQPTVAGLAMLIATEHTPPNKIGVSEFAKEELSRELPLSFSQQGIWLSEQLTGNRSSYLLSEAWRIRGSLNVDALQRALDTLVERHAPLRTGISTVGGRPVQTVAAPCRVALDVLIPPMSSRSVPDIERLAAAEADRPFDLRHAPLLRASLLTVSDDEAVFLVTVHHVASDAWSQQVLRRELETLYRAHCLGLPPGLNHLTFDYSRFTRRQRQSLDTHRESHLTRYWREKLEGLPPLDLPTDRIRPAQLSDCGAECTFSLAADLTEQLHSLAAAHQVTLHMVLLAAYQILLARCSGQVDFGIATMAAGRGDADCADLIGLFVNTLVLRADLSGDPTLTELLGRIRRTSLGAYDHDDLPFENVVAALGQPRHGRLGALAQAMFQLIQFQEVPLRLEGLDCRPFRLGAQRVRFELEMTLRADEGGLMGTLAYSTDLFERPRIEQLVRSYRTLLENMVAGARARVADIELLTSAERDQQLAAWSGSTGQVQCDETVHQLFAEQARRTPDAIAISFGDRQLTYEQLNARADCLASYLQQNGICAGHIVAIVFDRSVELVVAALGVLKAGAAYLPIDPANPAKRSVFMIQDANVKMVVSNHSVATSLVSELKEPVPLVSEDDAQANDISSWLPAVVPSTSLAYVMYTSGSTGQPKGVAVPHRGIIRLVRKTNYIAIDASDGVAMAANPSFDASTFELWGALLNGARLIEIDRDTLLSSSRLSNTLRERRVTVLFLTTAVFHQHAAAAPGAFASLRCLLIGGEILSADAVRNVLRASPPQRLLNVYGPTENTTFSTAHEIVNLGDDEKLVPIGRPISGTTCYVLAFDRALLPVGSTGELYVGGLGLATGYVNRDHMTADRFVWHPFIKGERLFRNGDQVRWRADGRLEFLGRLDRQVKLRGHRVELDEIEHTLREHTAVSQCTVVVEDGAAGKRLIAYWSGRDQGEPQSETLRDFLRRRLPEHMIPSAIVRVTSLAVTANGKLDVAALPKIDAPPRPSPRQRREPRSSLESSIATIWTEVLGIEHADLDEDFFLTGGNSLLAVRVADMIERVCGRHVSVSDVFTNSTIGRLAEFLQSSSAGEATGSIVELRKGSSKTPLYLPPGILGDTIEHHAIASMLPADQPVYVLRDIVPTTRGGQSIHDVSTRLCDALCRYQPAGSLSLAGYSFSGLVAYEMARELHDRGRELQALVIFDTGPDAAPPSTIAEMLDVVWMFLLNLPRWVREDLIRTLDRETPARLWRSSRKLFRRVRSGLRSNQRTGSHERSEDIFDVSAWSPQLRAHVDNNLRALATFRYHPYPGNLVLFRAQTRPLFSSHTRDLGWTPFVGHLDIIDVPGNHHSMMKPPYLEILAARFVSLLASLSSSATAAREMRSSVSSGSKNERHLQLESQP